MPKILPLDLTDSLARVAHPPAATTTDRREGCIFALKVVPAAKLVCVWHVGVHLDHAAPSGANVLALEVANLAVLDRDHWRRVVTLVDLVLGLVPEGEADGLAGLVDNGDVALRNLVSGVGPRLDRDLGQGVGVLHDAQNVDDGVDFELFHLIDLDKLVGDLGSGLLVEGFEGCVAAKRNLPLAPGLVVLLVGGLNGPPLHTVNLVILEGRVPLVRVVVEEGPPDIACRVHEIDVEEAPLTLLVLVKPHIPLHGQPALNRPLANVGSDGDDRRRRPTGAVVHVQDP
mmetsp:Transcript_20172/g.46474  ORF Transcript_20172/g.46474 Transcript_20172/m.46474 type:complete len:286 (-) Transcript_20172:12-869(-)